MEIWDAYFKDGTPALRDLYRGEPIPEGLFHLVTETLVRHTDGDYLIMLRDPKKTNFGGYFEASAGGSALKGEDAGECALRELYEECGIKPLSIERIGKYVSRDTIYISFLCVTDCEKTAVTLQEGETVDFKWLTEKEFSEFIRSDKFIPVQKYYYSDYFKKIGIDD